MKSAVTLLIALTCSVTCTADQNPTGPPVALQDLTVPSNRLPDGCELLPVSAIRTDENRIRLSLMLGLWTAANPWVGTERSALASIGERVEGMPAGPDGPPLDRREHAQFRLRMADGIDEGYAAVYGRAENDIVIVYAARFAKLPTDDAFRLQPRRQSNALRMTFGRIVTLVEGGPNHCLEAVEKHLRSLGN
jgi:hypothetical protein